MGKKKALAEAEIWDDSELVQSWNEAYEEYKKYHSLAVKGEKVSLDPENVDSELTTGVDTTNTLPSKAEAYGLQNQQSTESQASATAGSKTKPSDIESSVSAAKNGISVPQALLNSVQDEDVKNLMMSWYYAGYYTGLYEGKQQALASMQQQEEGH